MPAPSMVSSVLPIFHTAFSSLVPVLKNLGLFKDKFRCFNQVSSILTRGVHV